LLGRRICDEQWKYSGHTTINYELVLVSEGEVYATIDKDHYVLYPGDCLLLKPDQVFSSRTNPENPCRYYIIHFKLRGGVEFVDFESVYNQINSTMKHYDFNEMIDIFKMPQMHFSKIYLDEKLSMGSYKETIFLLIEKAIAERNQLSISSEIVISCYLCEIFVLLSRLTIKSLEIKQDLINDTNTPHMIQEAIYFIHENYTRPISLNELCEYLGRTPQHIIRIFKNYFRKTPIQYINHFRVSRSKDLLQYTSLSVNEISYEVGIENPYYFCRLFKKVEGLTPSEFRSSKMMERPQL
jgi:YesN/AraC family two-component response regulator